MREFEILLMFAAAVGGGNQAIQHLVVYTHMENFVMMDRLINLFMGRVLPLKIPRHDILFVPPEHILQPEQVEDYRNELRRVRVTRDDGEGELPTEIRRILILAAQHGRCIGMTTTEFQQHLIDVAETARRNMFGFRGVSRGELLPYFTGNDPHSMIQFKSVDSLTENERNEYRSEFIRLTEDS